MRISDWSSDVCSSDLAPPKATPATAAPRLLVAGRRADRMRGVAVVAVSRPARARTADRLRPATAGIGRDHRAARRSERRRHRLFAGRGPMGRNPRSEEHTSELQSLMRISYAVFCLKKKKITHI